MEKYGPRGTEHHPVCTQSIHGTPPHAPCPKVSWCACCRGRLAGTEPVYQFAVHGASRLDLAVRCTAATRFDIFYDGGRVATATVVPGTPLSVSPFTGPEKSQWLPPRPLGRSQLAVAAFAFRGLPWTVPWH